MSTNNSFRVYTNPFFDDVIVFMDNMPSASDKYKLIDAEEGIFKLLSKNNVKEFMISIRERLLAKRKNHWPYEQDLYMAVSVSGSKKNIHNKDLDNLLKTLFDSLKGIVFKDDSQIIKLTAEKEITDLYQGVIVALKVLRNNDRLRITPYVYSSGKDDWEEERLEKAKMSLQTFFDNY